MTQPTRPRSPKSQSSQRIPLSEEVRTLLADARAAGVAEAKGEPWATRYARAVAAAERVQVKLNTLTQLHDDLEQLVKDLSKPAPSRPLAVRHSITKRYG